jgi:hypothetical protein
MTARRDIDQLLGEFFAEGPASLPAETQRRVLSELATTPQRRHWMAWAHRRRTSLRGLAWAALVAGLVVVVLTTFNFGGIGPAGSHPPSGSSASPVYATPSGRLDTATAPPSWAVFRSSRFGYSLRYPPGFLISEVPGSPPTGSLMNAPGTDQLNDPGVAQVGIDRLTVAAGSSIEAWRTEAAPRDAACPNPERLVSVTVGAEPGLVDLRHCGGRYVLVAYIIHGAFGYEVYWSSPGGNESTDLAVFLRVLGGFQFVP